MGRLDVIQPLQNPQSKIPHHNGANVGETSIHIVLAELLRIAPVFLFSRNITANIISSHTLLKE